MVIIIWMIMDHYSLFIQIPFFWRNFCLKFKENHVYWWIKHINLRELLCQYH